MHHRRSSAIAAGALLAVTGLSSCGFDYQTDQVNTISAGVNNRTGDVDVLGGAVIAGQPDAGVFVGSLANNVGTEDRLVSLTGGEDGQLTPIGTLEPITVPPNGGVSLFQEGGIPVQGTFGAGDFVTVTLGFESGQTTTLDVAVVRPCYQYADKVEQPTVPGSGDESTATGDEADDTTSAYSCNAPSPTSEIAPEPAE